MRILLFSYSPGSSIERPSSITESGESTISFLSDEIVIVEFLYEKSIYYDYWELSENFLKNDEICMKIEYQRESCNQYAE